jgi:hypothetical protein
MCHGIEDSGGSFARESFYSMELGGEAKYTALGL